MVSVTGGDGDVSFVFTVTNATGPGLASVQNSVNSAAKNISGTVGSRFNTINDAVRGVEESFRRLGNTLVGAGGALTGTFTLPLVLGLKSLTTAGTEFETELYRVTSLFADAEHPVQNLTGELKEFAQALSIKSQFSGTEVLQTMYIMGQAGYTLGDIYSATNPILELATAQQYDLAQTFGIVNAVLKSYNLTAADSEKVVNMLASAATQFNLSMDDLKNGLKYVLPTAKSLDMELSEMLVMLGALTDRGFKGQQAGRIIRDTFSDLIAPVDSSRAILEKYNLELYTNQEAINGVNRAYSAATQKLEYMERGTLGSKLELAELSSQIQQNEALISKAKLAGNITDVNALTLANANLKDTYAYLNGDQKVNTALIAQQRQVVEDLGAEVDNTTVEGLLPFHEIIAQIAESGMTAAEIYTVFGKQSGGAIIALTDIYKNNHDYFNQMIEIVETKLAAQEQAAIQMQSTAFQVKQLKEAMDQLRIEGYMALAPLIQEVNKWMLANMDTLKELVRMIIEGLLPPLKRFLGALQGIIDWFTGLKDSTQKMIIGIVTGAAVFLAAVGPILLYVGALSWGIASMIGLARRTGEVIYVAYNFVKSLATVGAAASLSSTSVGGLATAIGITGAAEVESSVASVAAAQGYTIVGAGAAEATPFVATLGTTIMAALPYLAIIGIAAYLLYAAWKTDWDGMATRTTIAAQEMGNQIDNVILPAIGRLKSDAVQIGGGGKSIISGLIDVDANEIAYGVAKLAGGISAAFRDLSIIWNGLGQAVMAAVWAGMTGGDAVEEFNKQMEGVFEWEKFQRAAAAGLVEGYSGGARTIDQLTGELVYTQEYMDGIDEAAYNATMALDKKTDATETATDTERKYGMAVYKEKDIIGELSKEIENSTAAKMTFNNTPLQLGTDASGLTIVGIIQPTVAKKEGEKAGKAIGEGLGDSADDIQKQIMDAIDNGDYNKITELLSGDNYDILTGDAADLGKDMGENLGENMTATFLEYLEQVKNAQADISSYEMPSLDTTAAETKLYSWKEATINQLTEIGGKLYSLAQVNAAVAGEKSYDGEYRSLNEIMADKTSAGIYAVNAPADTKVADAAAAAATGSSYLEGAVSTSPSAAAAAGAMNIQNYFNITTNVYPKQAMDAAEINSLGDKITSIVETKLGEKYSSDEAV
jgi:hypothetical protein